MAGKKCEAILAEISNSLRVVRATKMTGTMVIELQVKDGGVARAYCSVRQEIGKKDKQAG